MSITVAAALGLAITGLAAPSIDDVWQSNLRDATFTGVVQSASQRELKKINKDFAQSYRFSTANVRLEEPFKVRVDSKVDDMDIVFVVNGPTKRTRVPRAKINVREDVSRAPGKRQTALDFGLLTPSLFRNFFQAKYVRTDRKTGDYVFDLTYVRELNDDTRHRIWVDPQKRVVTKREWYTQLGGYLLATFSYTEHKQVSGVWFPTKLTVANADGKVAGSTLYRNIAINQGIDNDLFSVN